MGCFDENVVKALSKIKKEYKNINAAIVLAYPECKQSYGIDTVFLENIETVPPKFAIDRRNIWMVEESDIVVAYVRHNSGGAAKFLNIAEKKGKEIIKI